MRNVLAASSILLLALGIAVGDEIKGKVTKVDGNKITVQRKASKKGGTATSTVVTVPEDAKILRVKRNKDKTSTTEPLTGGIGSVKVGSSVTVKRDGDKVTEVRVSPVSGKSPKKTTTPKKTQPKKTTPAPAAGE